MRRLPSIRVLLLGANAVVLLAPIIAVIGLRLYDVALLRQTERQLVAESVLIGEAFRDAYVRAGAPPSERYRPPAKSADHYTPIEPMIDIGTPVLPANAPRSTGAAAQPAFDPVAQRAGLAVEPLMQRAQTFNLSAVRVLDARGCVIATTRSQSGECLGGAPEVQRALGGRYGASMRERISDEPAPPFGDLRRRGSVRVFTALPIWHDGKLIAIVAASRTGLDALSSLWQNRRVLLLVGLAALTLLFAAAFFFAWTIGRPLRVLTASARAIAAGQHVPDLEARGLVPREIAVLSEVLREMTDRLQRRADEAAERSADVSHELKTPLSAIRGAIELLRDSGDEMAQEQRERFIANIDADAERMERLVTRLLALARIESEASKHAEPIEVVAVVRALLSRYDDVQLEAQADLGTLAIREDHLASVVLNLVDNARRHGVGQPVTVRIERERASDQARDPERRVRIQVIDRGPGIREPNRARLFDRFFTTERDRGGTGLGLAIVKAVADARGGSVSVTSTPTETTFSVVL